MTPCRITALIAHLFNRRSAKWHLRKRAVRLFLGVLYRLVCFFWQRLLQVGLGLGFVSVAITSAAGEIRDLYATWVPVDDLQQSNRDAALESALARVLIKTSGKRTVLQQAAVSQALSTAPAMVQQYSYQSRSLTAGNDKRLGLWVEFDKTLINSTLNKAHIPTWGNIRPTTLLWMKINDDTLTQTNAMSVMRRVESQRGVSLVLSQLQVDHQSGIDTANPQHVFNDTIRYVLARYGAQALLIAHIQQTASGFFTADWTLYIEGVQQKISTADDHFELVIEEGLQRVIDRLADLYLETASSNQMTPFNVMVNGINNFHDITRTLQALRLSDRLQYVQPNIVYRDKATFNINVIGSQNMFLRVISMGGSLALYTHATPPNTQLTLQLLPLEKHIHAKQR